MSMKPYVSKAGQAIFSRFAVVSYDRSLTDLPFKHNQPWTIRDQKRLVHDILHLQLHVNQVAAELGRLANACALKLANLGFIRYEETSQTYFLLPKAEEVCRQGNNQLSNNKPAPELPTFEKETAMSTKNIETVVYIQGQRADVMSDEEIFDLIGSLEARIKGYDAIAHKPKKLVKLIEQISEDINTLVSYVDGREDASGK